MSKQSKLAAWQSPAPEIKKVTKPEPKVTKITEALEVPVIEVPVVEATPDPVVEAVEVAEVKQEVKTFVINITEELTEEEYL